MNRNEFIEKWHINDNSEMFADFYAVLSDESAKKHDEYTKIIDAILKGNTGDLSDQKTKT